MAAYPLVDEQVPGRNFTFWNDTRTSSATLNGNIATLARRVSATRPRAVPAAADGQIAELQAASDFVTYLDALEARILAQATWPNQPHKFAALLFALANTKLRFNQHIAQLQGQIHNFAPAIMNVVGFDINALLDA